MAIACEEVNMKTIKLLPFLAAALPFSAPAGPYGPFNADENYVVALNGCEAVEDVRQAHPPFGTVEFSRAGDEAMLRLTMTGITHYEAQVFSDAAPRSQTVNVNVQVTMPGDIGADDAVCDDLNGDGVSDFVVELWRHGNGLAASFYDRLIALSSGENYRFWVIPTMDPSGEDFVRFSPSQPILMVTRQFVQKTGNAERASYFVYDLWSFSDGEAVAANSVDPRFPKWVRYTLYPNSRPAISLSDDDKRRLRSVPQPIEALP
jgi:hypothetical protein